MPWIRLQMILLCSFLIPNDQTDSFTTAAASSEQCISEDKLRKRTNAFRRKYWDKTSVSKIHDAPQDARTCEQVAKEMYGDVNNRSLSPWKYRLDKDENRFPTEISVAQCLCEGCIIKHHEEMSYNSVLVYAELLVLKKAPCPYNSNQYVVKMDFIPVAVACTCVVPKYAKMTETLF